MYQYEALNLTSDTVAANLNVDPSTVCRTWLFCRTGHVTKKQYDASNLPCELNDTIQLILLQVVLERPAPSLGQGYKRYVTAGYAYYMCIYSIITH